MPARKRQPASGWEGLLDPETGRLASSVPLDALWVPGRVEMDRAVLCFDWAGSDYVRAPSALLERFLGLRTDAAILSFARRFGPLGLSGRDDEMRPDPQPFGFRGGERRESLTAWRRYQWEFNALLALAAAVREGVSPDRETFERFRTLGVGLFLTPEQRGSSAFAKALFPPLLEEWASWSLRTRLETATYLLRDRTTTFIRSCGLRPALTIDGPPGKSRVRLVFQDYRADLYWRVGLSLFGALTVQLLAAATGAGFAVCSACGSVFVPRRRQPAFGKRRYCRTCGRTAALKDAKADYRARLRTKEVSRRSGK